MAEIVPAVRIESVVFDPRFISISFTEDRKNETPGITEVTTLNIAPEYVEGEVAEALDSLLALLDAAQVAQRHPPERIR